MAFYTFNDFEDSGWNPYNDYSLPSPVPFQDSSSPFVDQDSGAGFAFYCDFRSTTLNSSFSSFFHGETEAIPSGGSYSVGFESPPICYGYPVYGSSSTSRISYSESAFGEPKSVLMYEKSPNSYAVRSHFTSLYSVKPERDVDFDEYDPTPYGGGYNIAATYGDPLPPSDETCYPRAPPLAGAIIPSPIKSESPKPPVQPIEQVPRPELVPKDRSPKPIDEGIVPPRLLPVDKIPDGNSIVAADEGKGTHEQGGFRYNWVGAPSQYFPAGYGLEAMDICDCLFGPWPCLSISSRQTCCCKHRKRSSSKGYGDEWSPAANYLFGNPNPYHDLARNGYWE